MSVITYIVVILQSVLNLYLLVLLWRVVLDWVGIFARRWRPKGVVLLAGNVVYALTDPPLNRLRRLVPGLRLGGAGIDLSFLALYAAIIVIQYLLGALIRFA